MKEYTENELKTKAEAYCAKTERCPFEVEQKLIQWGADEEMTSRILASLVKDRFIDTARYCKAFVRDKYRFARWGKNKIAQALRMKRLPAEDIRIGLEEIDEDEYDRMLRETLAQKEKQVTGKNDYECAMKLIRFAVSRGFTLDEVKRYIRQASEDEYLD
ncbi:regulatory protein RecX [Bacteroides sp. An322]|uniref:regulatory protein RecX n=1 Tax=Bacteroides sp. An322 TaxID=1965632 RepID=UPI000B3AA816|nr:regulatory protein RecX [Bacteroides sp. An322]OUO19923.1 hypothetical protein B5F91_07830 [Bacteroides sp. An322]